MSLRRRIAVTAAAAVAVAIAFGSVVAYVVVRDTLRGQIDASLKVPTAGMTLSAKVQKGVQAAGEPLTKPPLFIQRVSAGDRLIARSGQAQELGDQAKVREVAAGTRAPFFADTTVDGAHVRYYTAQAPGGGAVQVARPMGEVDGALRKLRMGLGGVALLGVALAAFLGRLATRHAVRPVTDLTETAEQVARTRDLSRRIEATGGDELARLAASFNTMLEALEDSQRAQRQLVADASHERRARAAGPRRGEPARQRGEMEPARRHRRRAPARRRAHGARPRARDPRRGPLERVRSLLPRGRGAGARGLGPGPRDRPPGRRSARGNGVRGGGAGRRHAAALRGAGLSSDSYLGRTRLSFACGSIGAMRIAAAKTAFTSLFLGLGAVALLVGGVGIANVMVISVLERRSEVGLRRALGATRRHVGVQFLSESLLLTALGGIAGVARGALVTVTYAESQSWQAVLPPVAIAGGIAAATAIGAVAGLYPALRAARLSPTDALRSV
jgi:HAMP domain-containing protein